MVGADSLPKPEQVVEVVGQALRPLGFSTEAKKGPMPKPARSYYIFSIGGGEFAPSERVDVFIKYDDLSISFSDYARGSKASTFDRRLAAAIQTSLQSQLGADITFTHPQSPAFCLGP